MIFGFFFFRFLYVVIVPWLYEKPMNCLSEPIFVVLSIYFDCITYRVVRFISPDNIIDFCGTH